MADQTITSLPHALDYTVGTSEVTFLVTDLTVRAVVIETATEDGDFSVDQAEAGTNYASYNGGSVRTVWARLDPNRIGPLYFHLKMDSSVAVAVQVL